MQINKIDENSSIEKELNSVLKEKLGLGQSIQILFQDFIKQLSERLEKMEETLVVDRIEEDIAVCENRKDGKIKNIELSKLPNGIKDGDIIIFENGKYKIDTSKNIEQTIEKKMKNVWK